MDINLLVKITSRAWALPILALMISGTPGRKAPLLSATGAGRTAFSQSLAHLMELGLVERNPGHGHPLRPEFRLTQTGAEVAAAARDITRIAPRPEDQALLRRSWSLPVLTVSPTPVYFRDIKARLPRITDRALSQSLKHLHAKAWLDRQIDAALHPPRPTYMATNTGAKISNAILRRIGTIV